MNTRMFWTPGAWWFGGGADLNPMIEDAADTAAFHAALKAACDAHDPGYYPRFKAWADDYFLIRHRNEPRGVGGIFYDDLCTGDWEADFAFTQDVGRAFLAAFVPITERHMREPWTEAEREIQLVKRGRYAEFNLVYDRGTQFGLRDRPQPGGGADVAAAGREVAVNVARARSGAGAGACAGRRALSAGAVVRSCRRTPRARSCRPSFDGVDRDLLHLDALAALPCRWRRSSKITAKRSSPCR